MSTVSVGDVTNLGLEIRAEFPSFRILPKEDSKFMLAIYWFLKIITFGNQRAFLTSFITTIGYTVYIPTAWPMYSSAEQMVILRHERVHMRQRRKYSMPVFSFLYLFVLPGGLAYFRKKFEMEAYEESIRAANEYGFDITADVYRDRMIHHFTTGEYFWMWPFKSSVLAWFEGAKKKTLEIS